MNRSPVFDGPPSNMMPLDIEPLVARWAEARAAREALVEVPTPAPVTAAKRRWFRRSRS